MLYSGKQIVTRIRKHVERRGGAHKDWVVGVDREPRVTLFTKHGVRKVGDCWILIHAESAAVARKVRSYLVKKLGMSDELPMEDSAGDFVYAYVKAEHTQP